MPKCVTLRCPNIVHEEEIWDIEIVHRFQTVDESDYKEQVSFAKDRLSL
jgi:hypothetical protein